MAIVQMRLPDEEKRKIEEDAIKCGFVNSKGEANITQYLRFLAKNVKITVELSK